MIYSNTTVTAENTKQHQILPQSRELSEHWIPLVHWCLLFICCGRGNLYRQLFLLPELMILLGAQDLYIRERKKSSRHKALEC